MMNWWWSIDHDDHDFSAAISNIHVDSTELITDDYDGIVILRWVLTKLSFLGES